MKINRLKLTEGIQGFLSFLFWMMVFGLLVRIFEAALLGYYHEEFWKRLSLCFWGFGYDLLVFSKWSLVLCPVYLLIHHFSEKAARWTFRILGTLFLLTSNAMIMYYVNAYLPLDKLIFDYSLEEILYVAHSTGSYVWWGYVGLLLIPALFLVVSGRQVALNMPWLWFWLVLAAVGLCVNQVPKWAYNDLEERNTIGNKHEFFWKSFVEDKKTFSRFDAKDLERERERILSFQSMFPEDEFVDYRYPFAHVDRTPDVLSDFFDLNPGKMPNLVFIVTEGLSREFSGHPTKYPSPTPFLDSLADHSLNWINCMSSSQRTIAVLPTLFGSLPFGKRGFMQSSNCPRFYSLVGILKDNGYYPSFFYGGWLCFDDMCYFLNDLGIEGYLPDHNTYPQEIQNTWGLLDGAMFTEALKQVDDVSRPRLDIYLTLSTHDPFDYPDKERYTREYKAKLKKSGQLDQIQPSQYEQYASYLYYDECLRAFFNGYKDKPGYENTIFVITGDHCFNAQSEEIDKYHVPLIVWSPMLKEARRFPAMVAHRDITPSFLAFLKGSYGIQTPSVVSWINTGLDTSSVFRANTFTPQLKNSRKMDNMVYKDYFYDEGNIYRFGCENDRLTLASVKEDRIVALMSEYKAMDDYVMNNDALVKLDEDKQRLILDVDSTQQVNYVMVRTYVRPQDTLDHENTFKLTSIYPFNVFKEPVYDSLASVIVYCDFDIYIPRIEEVNKMSVVLAIEHADGQREVLKTLVINYDWYEYYDRWQHYSMTQTVNKALVHYTDGDQLMCYFTDGGQKEFYIADFNLKIVGIHE